MKLELKHLAPYLPYGLMASASNYDLNINGFIGEICSWECSNSEFRIWNVDELHSELVSIGSIKPILRPLTSMKWEEARELMSIVIDDDVISCIDIEASALENKVEIISCTLYGEYKIVIDNYDSDIKAYYEYYNGQIDSYLVTYQAFQCLFKNHFDIFGLIEAGLAVEK